MEADPKRDTTATVKATRAAKKAKREAAAVRKAGRAKRDERAHLRPKGLEGRALQRDPKGGWSCSVCKKHSINWSSKVVALPVHWVPLPHLERRSSGEAKGGEIGELKVS